mgnify:CR=1 FL=1
MNFEDKIKNLLSKIQKYKELEADAKAVLADFDSYVVAVKKMMSERDEAVAKFRAEATEARQMLDDKVKALPVKQRNAIAGAVAVATFLVGVAVGKGM